MYESFEHEIGTEWTEKQIEQNESTEIKIDGGFQWEIKQNTNKEN